MGFQNMSCSEFIEVLSSKAPIPGGGGASALVGAVGMALGNMVGNLTLGKKKYQEVEPDLINLMGKADTLQKELLKLIDRDAEGFEPLAGIYKLPVTTEEEKAERLLLLEAALKDASVVPLKIMEKCCEAIELHKEFAVKGSSVAISDVGCGVLFCKAALQAASLNVFINTKFMVDREYAGNINQKAETMLGQYVGLADEIFHQINVDLLF